MIISVHNEKIKNIIKLRKSRERKKQDLIIIEGYKEIEMALQADIEISELFYCSDFLEKNDKLLEIDNKIMVKTDSLVFKKISYRDNPDGFLALARPKYKIINNIALSKNPLVIILEAIEKPGNLGAILRSADAVGADAIIINDSKTDIYNPNVIRASRGTIFTKQIAISSFSDTSAWLKKNNIKSFGLALTAKQNYLKVNFKVPSAIVLGSEDMGLSEKWLKGADELIKIKMKGKIDSLNVSVTAGVILFEALRQRNA